MKIRLELNGNNNVIVIGFVGHTTIESLVQIKREIESLPNLKIIFFKTSSSKLWLKEGEQS